MTCFKVDRANVSASSSVIFCNKNMLQNGTPQDWNFYIDYTNRQRGLPVWMIGHPGQTSWKLLDPHKMKTECCHCKKLWRGWNEWRLIASLKQHGNDVPCWSVPEERYQHLLILNRLPWTHIAKMFQTGLCGTWKCNEILTYCALEKRHYRRHLGQGSRSTMKVGEGSLTGMVHSHHVQQ